MDRLELREVVGNIEETDIENVALLAPKNTFPAHDHHTEDRLARYLHERDY